MTFRAMRRFKPPEKRNKYGAKRTEYNGRTYHSKREADYAAELDLLMKAGKIYGWFPQHRFPLLVNRQEVCTYIADFLIILDSGENQVHEVKGFETLVWKLKRKLFEALYPHIPLKVIK